MFEKLDPVPPDDDGTYAGYYRVIAQAERLILGQFRISILNHQKNGLLWERTNMRWGQNEHGHYLTPCCQAVTVIYGDFLRCEYKKCNRLWRWPRDFVAETPIRERPYGYEVGKTPPHLR